jgi:Ribbon-helix-helix protein, copG family
MTRTVVSIDNDIKQWIDIKAAQEGVPMTELVRRALRQYREHEEQSVDRLLNETSGIWTAGDGLEYQQGLRDDWGK